LAQVSRTLGHLGSRIEPLCAAWPFIMSTPQVRDTLKYTRICKYWGSNRCKLGKDCNFAHSDLELRDQPDLVATRLCFQFSSKGRCKNGDACKFAHGKQELRTVPKAEQRHAEPMKIEVTLASSFGPGGEFGNERDPQKVLFLASLPPPGLFRPPPGLVRRGPLSQSTLSPRSEISEPSHSQPSPRST